jgi:hypothetical protein
MKRVNARSASFPLRRGFFSLCEWLGECVYARSASPPFGWRLFSLSEGRGKGVFAWSSWASFDSLDSRRRYRLFRLHVRVGDIFGVRVGCNTRRKSRR